MSIVEWKDIRRLGLLNITRTDNRRQTIAGPSKTHDHDKSKIRQGRRGRVRKGAEKKI